jgi:hypothetical protein
MCSCSMMLMKHISMTRLPTKWVERTITGWEEVCVASHFITTMIPSAHLVAVMWLQHTWCPRFRRGIFGYGTTASPNIREISMSRKLLCECPLVPSRFTNACAMQMHAQEGTYLFIYLFIFEMFWARPWGISSWLKVRSNQDKYINTKIILVLQHVYGQKGRREIQVNGNNHVDRRKHHWRLNSNIKTFPLTW